MNGANSPYRVDAAKLLSQRRADTGRLSKSAASETNVPPMEQAQLPGLTTIPRRTTPNGPKNIPGVAPSEQPITLQSLPLERLLTTRQAAPILSESIDTLKKWRQRGLGPAYIKYESGVIRYRLSDLWQYLDDHTVECSSRKRHKQSLSEQTSGVRKKPLRTAA